MGTLSFRCFLLFNNPKDINGTAQTFLTKAGRNALLNNVQLFFSASRTMILP